MQQVGGISLNGCDLSSSKRQQNGGSVARTGLAASLDTDEEAQLEARGPRILGHPPHRPQAFARRFAAGVTCHQAAEA